MRLKLDNMCKALRILAHGKHYICVSDYYYLGSSLHDGKEQHFSHHSSVFVYSIIMTDIQSCFLS